MNKKPFYNAILAAAYITLIVQVINGLSRFPDPPKGTILAPMVFLSLFVLSAAVMGFLFVYEPARLFLDNKRREAVTFFAKTLGLFACFAVLFVILLLCTSLF